MNCWHCSTELIWGGDHDTMKTKEKLYGQQEQEDLEESMKEAFRQRDERLRKSNKEQTYTFTCRSCKADMKPGEISRIKGYCMDCC